MGKAIKKVTSLHPLVSQKDKLFGEKDMGVADRFVPLDKETQLTQDMAKQIQRRGLTRLEEMSGPEFAKSQSGLEKTVSDQLIRTGANDERRRLGDLVAQRGLQNSSVGLGQQLQIDKDLGSRIRASDIQQRMRENELNQQGLASLFQQAGGVIQTPGAQQAFIQGREGSGLRTGGLFGALAPLGGAAVGGYMGGPQGAAMGAQAGQSLGQAGRFV